MMMKGKWVHIGIGAVVLAFAAASAAQQPTADKAQHTSWDAAALHTAEGLATKLRAGGIKCDEYKPEAIESYGPVYRERLPLPAAVASCSTHADEDLTFEVFKDPAHTQDFIRAKQALLCKEAAKTKLQFPGFPYVDGGAWVVEPDEKATGDKIAPIVGGQSKLAACPVPTQ